MLKITEILERPFYYAVLFCNSEFQLHRYFQIQKFKIFNKTIS